jgi:galactokinase
VPEPTAAQSGVASLFAQAFGGAPSVIASAPGRVNLIGEHTDYNGGEVLPIGIAQRTWVAVRLASNAATSRAVSANEPAVAEWSPEIPTRAGEWWDYVSGVAAAFSEFGIAPTGLEIAVASNVPSGAGLSSSAALEVATAMSLAHLFGANLSERGAALLSRRVETQFVGVASGIMDQFASALAQRDHALHVHCDSRETEQVPMRDAVLIFDTGVPRSLRHSDFNTRRAECDRALELLQKSKPSLRSLAEVSPHEVRAANLPEPLGRRALHVTEETRRVQRAVDSLRSTGVIPSELLYQSHESLRTLYECSTPELDWFVHHASSAPGVRGARLTGAGWGGCAIALGERDALEALARASVVEYRSRFDLTPRTWITRAESGARVDFVGRENAGADSPSSGVAR